MNEELRSWSLAFMKEGRRPEEVLGRTGFYRLKDEERTRFPVLAGMFGASVELVAGGPRIRCYRNRERFNRAVVSTRLTLILAGGLEALPPAGFGPLAGSGEEDPR